MHRVIKFFGNEWYFKIQRKARDVSSYAYSQRNSIHVCYSSLHLVVRKDFYFFIVIQFLQYKTLANCLRRRHLASYRARLHQPHTSHQAKSVLRQAAPCSSSICVFNVLQLFGTDPKNAVPYMDWRMLWYIYIKNTTIIFYRPGVTWLSTLTQLHCHNLSNE